MMTSKHKRGQSAEHVVARWCVESGWCVLPTKYAYTGGEGTQGLCDKIILPDLMVASEGTVKWIEVKTHARAPWNRVYRCHVHGWKYRNHLAYLEAGQQTGAPVWLVIIEDARHVAPNERQSWDQRDRVGVGDVLAIQLGVKEPLYCLCEQCQNSGQHAEHLVYVRRSDMLLLDEGKLPAASEPIAREQPKSLPDLKSSVTLLWDNGWFFCHSDGHMAPWSKEQ